MQKVLIANRGEIAVRIIRGCSDAGLDSVAVYADVDADALHVGLATEAYALGGNSPADTYLNVPKLLAIARRAGTDAVHPGYGFLSENADFAQAVQDAGLVWIGPSPESIRLLGNKVSAREIAVRVGAPLVEGSNGTVETAAEVRAFAEEHGLPVAIKAAFGGGGRGMKVVWELDAIEESFDSAVRESVAAFGRGECYVERFLNKPRHVEAQILADGNGTVIVVGTRDCSLQRRNQKLVEEAPAPFLTADQRDLIYTSAKAICREAGYIGAGTVEYLLADDGSISFLEVNTRLQVEHPITEETSGVDLVLAQLAIAAGGPLPVADDPVPHGHSFEFRINAEDPGRGFLPSPGTVTAFTVPTGPGIRVDAGIRSGDAVAPQFDSLLAKLIVTGADRAQALRRARRALAEFEIAGLPTVLPFHRAVVNLPAFIGPDRLGVYTSWIETEFAEQIAADSSLMPAAPALARRTITIELDGRRVALGLPENLLAGFAQGSGPVAPAPIELTDPAELRSTMSGTVVKWLVDAGATVAAGEPLLVLEAMKMESTVVAHRSGRLVGLIVAPGDAVAVHAVVATIEA
ncbi:ATP-grasp domain-containing protein [Cryobacterium levicorallinum]|uniref:biotin carboxylase n=1 Tax=Cryobacterium levicorallinum TaxID=995038 RepID=A0A1I3C5X1_9MICO|nr:biotin carboxylase N-terminal domain-containing protein [Cryobacterium levicorallinum]TFB83267.1 ATP-grasp domain-containing protein [Cryobacterium levicorallinum]GEP27562.1 acetyl/propionyl-CoA carboxylase subunit alpha [Cryobacterium levicorallinum]SFH69932.1 acetyl-CoA/propionyl-CoA carboxylase, biotin carboxylase, biotin carboxyl carrier protein [Cryobacterium levicorallinum]